MPSLNSNNSVNVTIGTTADKSGLDDVQSSLGGMVDSFESGMKKISVATGAVAVGLTAFAKSSTNYLEGLVVESKSLSRQTGMTVEDSSKLIAVLGRMGVSADQASSTFKVFEKQIQSSRDNTASHALATDQLQIKVDAAQKQVAVLTQQIKVHGDASGLTTDKIKSLNLTIQSYKEQISATKAPLDDLGVSTQNADGTNRSFDQILLSVADKFKAMPDGVDKTSVALKLFGRNGTEMIKVLDQGSQGLKDLEDQAGKLGLTLTAQNIGAINDYIKSQKDLKDSTDSIKIAVGNLTAPILTKFNETLNNVAQKLIGVDSPFRQITANVLAFGGPMLAAVSSTTGFLGNLSSALPLLKTVGVMLVNPAFLLFAIAVAGIAESVLKLHTQLGSWHAVMTLIEKKAADVFHQVKDYLEPSFVALYNTLVKSVIPVMNRLWKEVIEPFIPVLGVLFVGAIKLTADTLNALLNVATPVINFFLNHKWIILDFAAAFGVLAGAMAFNAVFNALSVGFATFTLVTIPSAMASITAFKTYVASGTLFGPIIITAALIALQQVYDAAQKTKAAVDGALNAQAKAADQSSSIKDLEAKYKAGKISKTQETNAINALLKGVDSTKSGFSLFATGGYTGKGDKNEPAGIVHKGEYVVPKEQVDQTTGKPKVLGGMQNTFHIYNNADMSQALAIINWKLATL